jgi:hypothetical protein
MQSDEIMLFVYAHPARPAPQPPQCCQNAPNYFESSIAQGKDL